MAERNTASIGPPKGGRSFRSEVSVIVGTVLDVGRAVEWEGVPPTAVSVFPYASHAVSGWQISIDMQIQQTSEDASLFGDRIDQGDVISLSEDIVASTCRLAPHGSYTEATILHEGSEAEYVVRLSSVSSDNPVVELPKSARPIGVTTSQSGHTLVSVTPKSAYENSSPMMKRLVPLIDGFRGGIDVSDATIFIPN